MSDRIKCFKWKNNREKENQWWKREKNNRRSKTEISGSFKPETYFVKSQFISEKRSSTFTLQRNKLESSANMTGFSFPENLQR